MPFADYDDPAQERASQIGAPELHQREITAMILDIALS
jgi:hypothetical protein